MKKKILFCTIFSICIVMMVNTSSAIEHKIVIDYNKDLLETQLEKINNFIEYIRLNLDDWKTNSISIISNNEIGELLISLFELKILIFKNIPFTNFIFKILGFIISLLFSIIGTIIGIIFGRIFGPLLALFVRLLTAPIVLFARIIAFIVNILNL